MKKIILIMMTLSTLLIFSGCSTNSPVAVPIGPTDDNGNIEVSIQDQYSEIIDLRLNRKLSNLTLLQPTQVNDRYIIANIPDAVPTLQDTICIKDIQGKAFYQARINGITSLGGTQYNISVDSPLDYAFDTGDGCALQNTNLAIDGSVEPVTFSISPCGLVNGTSWDITRIIILFGGTGIGPQELAPDDSDFGVTDALDNGVVLRVEDGYTKNIFNARTNADFRARAYDVAYTDKSKAGQFTVATRRTFAGQDKNGVTIRLDADTCDELQLIVQDDLTEMSGGQIVVQGHIVE